MFVRRIRPFIVMALLALTVGVRPASAQGTTGGVVGRVTLDVDGSPIHGATVFVVGARREATTNEAGVFTIENVPPGVYEVIAQREHLSAARQSVTVVAGERATADFTLTIEALHEEIAVTASASGTSTAFDAFSAITSLDSLELAARRGGSIAEALAGEPGISLRSFGPGSARPIIRGFDGDRVLIMQDGVRTGDLSSQSGDHGVSLDPAGLERLEVVKGPATLLYGGNAIGGVVNAITPHDTFRSSPFDGIVGGASFDAGSGNAQVGGAANAQYGRGPWLVWGAGGSRRAGDYDSPSGTIPNSGTELRNARFGVGWTGPRLFFSVGGQGERSRYGVPFASEFHGHEGDDDGGGDDESHADELDIDLLANRREVRIDGGVRAFDSPFIDTLKVTFAGTGYRHDELEVASGIESVGTRLRNDTRSVRFELEQKRLGRLSGRLGLDWLFRDYRAEGAEALSPRTRQQGASVFAYEEVDVGSARLQFGGRVETNRFRPDERPVGGHAHDADGEEPGDEHDPPPVRDRDFTGVSGSFGLYRELGRTGAVVVNVTTASRAPAIEELFNFGPHVGNLAFEVGDPDLKVERTIGLDASLRRRAGRVSGEVNVFTYAIRDFVYLDFTGEIADGLREAFYRQGDARFVGAEASTEVELGRHLHLEAGISAVRARLTATDEPLPRIPPVSGRVRLEIPWRGVSFAPELVLAASQRQVFRDEQPTAGYALVNFGASYFVVRGHATHQITLSGQNLADVEYRNHTSFLKDFAPEMGRSIRVTYSVRFF